MTKDQKPDPSQERSSNGSVQKEEPQTGEAEDVFALDLHLDEQALKRSMLGEPPAKSPPENQTLLELGQKIQGLEGELAGLKAQVAATNQYLGRLYEAITKGMQGTGREMHRLRQETTGDYKALVTNQAFNALLYALNNLKITKESLAGQEDTVTGRQLENLASLIGNTMQTMGFASFSAAPGEVFDPEAMESAGTVPGPLNLVMETAASGWKAGDKVVSACRVTVGNGESLEEDEES